MEQKSEEDRSISNISIDNKNVATNGDTTQNTTHGDNQRTAKSRDSDDSSSSSSDEEDKDPDKLRY